MEIKWKSAELDKRSLYKHTRASSVSLKDLDDGTIIDPVEIVVYEDVNTKGETNVITSLVDVDGTHYTTNSKYFREELKTILELMDGEPFQLIVRKNVSKNGRTFVTCELA